MERLISIMLTFLFYFTPIIYSDQMVPERYRHLIIFNPLAPLMMSWRDLFLAGRVDLKYIFFSSVYAVIFYAVGYSIYRKLSWKFAEIL